MMERHTSLQYLHIGVMGIKRHPQHPSTSNNGASQLNPPRHARPSRSTIHFHLI